LTLQDKIKVALEERKAKLRDCPIRRRRPPPVDQPCPKCRATTAGPCWLNVEADAAFVDAMKELIA
jgi:tRNA G26 N,N-dimethylase Trm1